VANCAGRKDYEQVSGRRLGRPLSPRIDCCPAESENGSFSCREQNFTNGNLISGDKVIDEARCNVEINRCLFDIHLNFRTLASQFIRNLDSIGGPISHKIDVVHMKELSSSLPLYLIDFRSERFGDFRYGKCYTGSYFYV
jgi:hypothetical protein